MTHILVDSVVLSSPSDSTTLQSWFDNHVGVEVDFITQNGTNLLICYHSND